jgi:hypothetical protein
MSVLAVESAASARQAPRHPNADSAKRGDTLEISESRTYDCALEILGAYKLTGNFPLDLEIVLKNLGVLGQVSFEIKPKSIFSDCRRVEFLAGGKIDPDQFRDILRRIESRIGSDSTPLSWKRLLDTARRSEKAS